MAGAQPLADAPPGAAPRPLGRWPALDRRATVRRWWRRGLCLLAAAVAAGSVARDAAADGYNDWPAETAAPGTVAVMPAVQLRLRPQASAYLQAQALVGLAANVDLIVDVAKREHVQVRSPQPTALLSYHQFD